MNVNWKGTYSNHSEKNTGRSERGLGWCCARRPLREIQRIDGYVQ